MADTPVVSIMGRKGAFHDIAADRFFEPIFPDGIRTLEHPSFPTLLKDVKLGKSKYGIMAIENSIAGTIKPNYPRLLKSGLFVIGEVVLRIKLNLCALPKSNIQTIKEVFSHRMAILESNKFFKKYPGIKLTEGNDTAGSAKRVAEAKSDKFGSISSKKAAGLYGLKVLEEGIEDNPLNFTRFYILSAQKKERPAQGRALISLEASENVDMGKVVAALHEAGTKIIQIHSIENGHRPWAYTHFIDLLYDSTERLEQLEAQQKDVLKSIVIMGGFDKGSTFEE